MGGGSAASFRWRRILLMTSPCVMTAMIRSAPRWHNGQVTISRANTRFRSRAQLQCGDAARAPHLPPPMRRNLGLSVERKAVHTGTPRTGEPGRFALRAKARADAALVLSGSFSTSDALLDRSRHGAGELRCGVA